jgi:hypothetical protein
LTIFYFALQRRWFLLVNLDDAAILFLIVGLGLLVSAFMSAGRAAGGVATLERIAWKYPPAG